MRGGPAGAWPELPNGDAFDRYDPVDHYPVQLRSRAAPNAPRLAVIWVFLWNGIRANL